MNMTAARSGFARFGQLICVGLMLGLTAPLMAAPAGQPPPSAVRGDRILIKPKEGVQPPGLSGLHNRMRTRVLREFPRVANWQVLELPANANVNRMIAAYLQSGLVAAAEPDHVLRALFEPNDARFQDGSLWNLHNTGAGGGQPGVDISAPEGWDFRHEAGDVIVAIVDTGIRYTHEDLAANMWVNPGEIPGNGIDDDGNGFIDDVHGINAISGTGDPFDDHGHGTHVSGTLGAEGDNEAGIVGVCWGVRLMACKFLDSQGLGTISDVVTSLDYARNHGASIVTGCWGDYQFTSAALRDAINSLRNDGIIFVAASGNDGSDNDSHSLFPASYEYDNVLAVAATDAWDGLAFFSNFGAGSVDLAAPGAPILSTVAGSDSDYAYFQGTSMGVPHVAGACALVWAQNPHMTHHEVIGRVLDGVDALPQLEGRCVTDGRLNLARTLAPRPSPSPEPETVWVDDALPEGAVPVYGSGGTWTTEPWTWVSGNPAPFSGAMAHQSDLISGIHLHSFENATGTLQVYPGDVLFTHVYLDPENPPRQVMLGWNDGCWEHRAFWGENLVPWGEYGTSNRRHMGDLPPAGQWVRLEVPASLLGLEGATLSGMSFILVDGRAAWDRSGAAMP